MKVRFHVNAAVLLVLITPGVCKAYDTPEVFANVRSDFERNEGQAPSSVAHFLREPGFTAVFDTQGAVSMRFGAASVGMSFVNGARTPPEAEESSDQRSSYYTGKNPNDWRVNVLHSKRLRSRSVYRGTDVVFYRDKGLLKYDLEFAPGADATAVGVRFTGIDRLRIAEDGALIVTAAGGVRIRYPRPPAYQPGPTSAKVKCDYRLTSRNTIGFTVGKYDRRRPLIIDPDLMLLTYLGGSAFDSVQAMATDSVGNIYVAGETASADFLLQSQERSDRDVWVAKLDSTGTRILYRAFLTGSNRDTATGLALGSDGAAYLTGFTSSPDFPVVQPFQGQHAGLEDAFVAKLNPAGTLVYSTFFGGPGGDHGWGIAVDATGAAFVAGQTASTAFPVTVGALRTLYGGGASDGFAAKLAPNGSRVYATYYGGAGLDVCRRIAVAGGNAYLTGTTESTDLPVQSAIQSQRLGSSDAFVAALNSTGSSLVFGTYLGGSASEVGNGIAVDGSLSIYVAGGSISEDFGQAYAGFRAPYGGGYDAFTCKLTPSGNAVTYCARWGGEASDTAEAIAVSRDGQAIVAGSTASTGFLLRSAVRSRPAGVFDGFLTVLSASGGAALFSTYIGGSSDDRAVAVVPGRAGSAFVAGLTFSTNLQTTSALQGVAPGSGDGFLTQLRWLSPTRVFWQNTTTGEATIWSMTGQYGTALEMAAFVTLGPVAGWRISVATDLNSDGYSDLIWQNQTTGQATVWYMGGDFGTTIIGAVYLTAGPVPGWRIVAAGDLNKDGTPDLIWQNETTREATVWLMGGQAGLTILDAAYLTGPVTGWRIAGAADFNADGVADIVWQNDATREATLWYMGGRQGISILGAAYLTTGPAVGWRIAATLDLNGDGHPDLVWQNDSDGAATAWYMTGSIGNQFGGSIAFAGQTPGWRISSR